MVAQFAPYAFVFLASLVATLLLTPLVRELHRRWGLVDVPDARRINKVPVPRGGGVAIVLGVILPYLGFHLATGRPWLQGCSDGRAYVLVGLSVAIALLGLADDKFSLPPKAKLLGQVAVAALAWAWGGLGFRIALPWLPAWADCLFTVFWIVGAVNAFNLIDGLDGLASGLALVAVVGVGGSLFFARNPQATLFYFALAGGILGFLRYNYNPASVFLGDSGSMFLGFVVATLPLASQTPNSVLTSVGVPLLAMGVPIFDTSLAIVRRSLRYLIAKRVPTESAAAGEVMTADKDHLHHRILRRTGLNQRKAAWILYLLAAGLVATGLLGVAFESASAGLWLLAFAAVATVVFKDSKIELFDAGRFLESVAHSSDRQVRRRAYVLAVPFYVFVDLAALSLVFFLCQWALRLPLDVPTVRVAWPVRVFATFACLAFFHAYRTAWSRAMLSNYARLFFACALGSIFSSAFIYYWPSYSAGGTKAMTLMFAVTSFSAVCVARVFRSLVRDLFYAIGCARLKTSPGVSRILVYGAGLRYRAFRSELVRTTLANDRMIVGILDDDVYLKGRFIGGIRICGTIQDASRVIAELHVDQVVVACEVSDEWLRVVRQILSPTGVRVSYFSLGEREVPE